MNEASPGTFLQGSMEAVESPGLRARELGAAFEMKFQLTEREAQEIEGWARGCLTPDGHGRDGGYRVTTVYCDTASLDVFRRTPGFRRRKYRLRRYDNCVCVYLECKTRWGDRVKKRRVEVIPDELRYLRSAFAPMEWSGEWFCRRTHTRNLRPSCRLSYQRSAFFGASDNSPFRMTLDRNIVGTLAEDWEPHPLDEGQSILPGGVLLELKFHQTLPHVFKELLLQLPLQQARVSKYRRCLQLCGADRSESTSGPSPV